MVLIGTFYQDEWYIENGSHYKKIMANPGRYSESERKVAQWNLTLAQLFDPQEPHNRLVAHNVDLYKIPDKTDLRKIKAHHRLGPQPFFSIDFGLELMLEASIPYKRERIIDTSSIVQLDDGTFMRGTHYELVDATGESALSESRTYFDIIHHIGSIVSYEHRFESSGFADEKTYAAVTMYTEIDSIRVSESRWFVTYQRKKDHGKRRLTIKSSQATSTSLVPLAALGKDF